jgi:NAD(P)-dependent dehydrogenase (short-subunit alcohol dehydrogenase family)
MIDAPDLLGRTMLVTGANTGIGRATACALAARGARLWLACRSREKTAPVLATILAAGGLADFVLLDLSDLASVRACAEEVLSKDAPLHVLLNNAGVAGLRGRTAQGFEMAFGTNHLGHFLLTELLLPRLRQSAAPAVPARIVNVSSKAHYDARGIDWTALQRKTASLTGLREYAVSKLCNVLFTRSLAAGKAGNGVRSYALHPGVVASDAWRHAPWPVRPWLKRGLLTNEEGARTSLFCATAPELDDQDGRYYDDCKEKEPSPLARDAGLADELWTRSMAFSGLKPGAAGQAP